MVSLARTRYVPLTPASDGNDTHRTAQETPVCESIPPERADVRESAAHPHTVKMYSEDGGERSESSRTADTDLRSRASALPLPGPAMCGSKAPPWRRKVAAYHAHNLRKLRRPKDQLGDGVGRFLTDDRQRQDGNIVFARSEPTHLPSRFGGRGGPDISTLRH